MDLEWNFAFLSYGEPSDSLEKRELRMPKGNTWRDKRKIFHSQFKESEVAKFKPMQAKAARDVVRAIMTSPQDLFHQIHMYVLASRGKIYQISEPTTLCC